MPKLAAAPRNILPKQDVHQTVALLSNPGGSQPQQLLLLIPPNSPNSNVFIVPPQKPYFRSVKGYIAPDQKRVGEICRTCYRAVFTNNYIKLFDEENEENSEKLRNMLKEVIPSLDLDIYVNPIMCVKCVRQLFESYEFKNRCQDTESKFGNWIKQRKNVQNNDVNLLILVENSTDSDEIIEKDPQPSSNHKKRNLDNSLKDHDYATKPHKSKKKFSYKILTGKTLPIVKSRKKGPCLCEHCGLTFKDFHTLKGHVEGHNEQLLQCHICGKSYRYHSSLRQHIISHNPEGYVRFVCDVCGKNFPLKSQYKNHVLKHQAPSFQCDICAKKFKRKDTLSKHLSIAHHNQSKFKCDICQKCYWKKEDLDKHVIRIHESGNEIYCDVCDVYFQTRVKYNLHLAEEHGDLACEICDMKFKCRQSVEAHCASFHGDGSKLKTKICDGYEINENLIDNTEIIKENDEVDNVDFNLDKENVLLKLKPIANLL